MTFDLWPTITGIIAIVTFLIGLATILFKLGKIAEKVDDQGKHITQLSAELHNGFQCKFHSQIMEKIGKVEGQRERDS
jgi:hypothetical protein